MDNMYGLGSYGTNSNSFVDTFFGTSGSGNSGSSLVSSLGDLQMIKSGVYKKAMKSLYATKKSETESGSDTDSIKESGTADSKVSLSNLKSSSQKLYKAANSLKTATFTEDAKSGDLLDKVKTFVKEYNTMLNATKNMNSYSILQTAVWGTQQMNVSEGLLNKVGISIGEDNTLSIDEDKFKEAKLSDLKTLFSGSSSLADRISQKASTLYNQSANQLAVNEGKLIYTNYGTLI